MRRNYKELLMYALQGLDYAYTAAIATYTWWPITMTTMMMAASAFENNGPREYCRETFNATCRSDEVILMQAARYGRMQFGRCLRENHGSIGCSADVLDHLDGRCSGRRSCSLSIPDPALHRLHHCPRELVPYLEASFSCIQVETSTRRGVCVGDYHVVRGETGYLASLTASEPAGVGSISCPWLIRADRGRLINLTLYSFFPISVGINRGEFSASSGRAHTAPECGHRVAVVDFRDNDADDANDGNVATTTFISACATGVRGRQIFSSSGHTVRVYVALQTTVIPGEFSLVSSSDVTSLTHLQYRRELTAPSTAEFILRYNVYGCSDVQKQSNAQIRRQGKWTSVRCNSTGETFYLLCVDSHWTGQFVNCSNAIQGTRIAFQRTATIHLGILMVIGICVSLGVALGVILLFTIMHYLQRHKHAEAPKENALLGELQRSSADFDEIAWTAPHPSFIHLSAHEPKVSRDRSRNQTMSSRPSSVAEACSACSYRPLAQIRQPINEESQISPGHEAAPPPVGLSLVDGQLYLDCQLTPFRSLTGK